MVVRDMFVAGGAQVHSAQCAMGHGPNGNNIGTVDFTCFHSALP